LILAYGFADVEAALAEMHLIADDRRSAFSNRLKHLQRLGFPPGVNTGRGRAATYYAEHAFLLGVALQLNELSISPERAIKVIELSFEGLAGGALAAINNGEPILCEVPTTAFGDLVHGHQDGDYSGITPIDAEYASKRLELMLELGGPVRWSLFSLSGLIHRLSDIFGAARRSHGFFDFKTRVAEWAEGVGGEEKIWRGRDFG
jgi:hypothetical protein